MSMITSLPPEHIFQESDSFTCGPCCLAMVYAKKGKKITLQDILKDFKHPTKGKPTYVMQLGSHLLKNGIKSKLIVSTSKVVSPAWKNISKKELISNLEKWLSLHPKAMWKMDVEYVIQYLKDGGDLLQESYSAETLKEMIDRNSLIILGVDEDWIWGHRFKLVGSERVIDEIGGYLEGHFVLVDGYNDKTFHVLDPFPTKVAERHGEYNVPMNTLINASLTWDSQILEILP